MPTFSIFHLPGTELMIDTSPDEGDAIYTRIHRSFYYNCEVKLFELNDKVRVVGGTTAMEVLLQWIPM
jgi:hypothetical protein